MADYLYNMAPVMDYVCEKYSVTESQIKFMLFVYSMESWRVAAVAKKLNRHKRRLWESVIKPLIEQGYVKEEMYSKGPSDPFYANVNAEELSSHKTGVSVRRWALSQSGRYLLSNFYRYLEGTQSMSALK